MRDEPTIADVVVAGHRGDRSVAAEALGAADPDVRAAALGALDRMGALDDDTLRAASRDPSPVVRRRVAELVATRPASDVDDLLHLLELLDDADPTVVEVAAWACGEQEQVGDDVLDRLIRLAVEADDAIVRESAAAALGAIGDPRGLPSILAACRDKPAVRRRAVLALAPFLDQLDTLHETHEADEMHDPTAGDADGATTADAVSAALEAALTDRDWQVRQAAEDLQRARRGRMW